MPLSPKHVRQLQSLIKAFEGLITASRSTPAKANSASAGTRRRRTGKELVTFQKTLAAERRSGVPVADLASKYGVTPSYIYQLPMAAAPKAKGPKPSKAKALTRKASARKAKTKPGPSASASATSQASEVSA